MNQPMKRTVIPGRIGASGTYLYQLNTVAGDICNLWGGSLSAQNNHEEAHLHRAVKLFAAAEDLLVALEHARNGLAWYQDRYPGSTDGSDDEAMALIDAAIAKAEG